MVGGSKMRARRYLPPRRMSDNRVGKRCAVEKERPPRLGVRFARQRLSNRLWRARLRARLARCSVGVTLLMVFVNIL